MLVVAVIALHQPKRTATAAGSLTAHQRTPAPSGGSSAAGSRSGSAAPPSGTGSGSSGAGPSGAATSVAGALPLVVLNNTTTRGLAQQAAQRFESGGWTVSHVDNLHNEILSTVAYYDPAVANARRTALALQRQFPTIKRVVPKFAQLPAGPIVVVLTPDYSAG